MHDDLLRQALHLARKEPRRPSQASLRHAVSASYYALFHLLIDEGTRLMLSGHAREPLRRCLARAFHHGTMKRASRQFSTGGVSEKLLSGYHPQALQQPLRRVASAFCDLQQARHEADYNLANRFTRQEALDLIDRAQEAFDDWRTVRGTLQADTYLTGLLALEAMQT